MFDSGMWNVWQIRARALQGTRSKFAGKASGSATGEIVFQGSMDQEIQTVVFELESDLPENQRRCAMQLSGDGVTSLE